MGGGEGEKGIMPIYSLHSGGNQFNTIHQPTVAKIRDRTRKLAVVDLRVHSRQSVRGKTTAAAAAVIQLEW